MRPLFTLIVACLLLSGIFQNAGAVITIHTIGDSTMSDYDESTTDKRGWAMMFQQFFTTDILINNRAKSGSSSKSFYQEAAYWSTVKTQIKAGDYVFIQFAHNDEKNNGLDGDTVRLTDPTADYRGTTAQGTFKTYLRAYINETRALGATPVLVTAICRKYFSGSSITRKGRHDLGENFGVGEDNHTYDYVYAMKEVAVEMNVQLIDMTALTKSLLESYGDAACTSLLFCSDDSTHPNAMGATLFARLCAQAMVSQNILAQYINASSDLLVNPSSCDFGNAYTGQTLISEFTLSGFDLTPASGSFTLSVSDGFAISASRSGEYTSSISLSYSNGNLDFTRFYASTTLTFPGVKTGTLQMTNGTLSKSVPLTANCIELTGGTEVKLFWELSANADYVLTGPAKPVAESWSNMYVQRYAAPNTAAIWPVESGYTTTRVTQRNLIVGDAWPAGEIDEVSTRYIQFGIAANDGTELNIDSIGMYVCGAGGNGMRCRISYSTNHFADYTVIREFSSMVSNTVYAVSSIPVLKISGNDTLLVRVYPWYNGAATGKTICLADVCIHGVAISLTSTQQPVQKPITCIAHDGLLSINGVDEECTIHIYRLTGQKIHSSVYHSNPDIQLKAPIEQGAYVCELRTANERHILKFIVK